MGFLDFLLSNSAKKSRAAEALGLETGLLQECPVCREVTERDLSEEVFQRTERLGEEWLAKSDPRVAVFKGDKEVMKKSVRETAKRAPFSCVCDRV